MIFTLDIIGSLHTHFGMHLICRNICEHHWYVYQIDFHTIDMITNHSEIQYYDYIDKFSMPPECKMAGSEYSFQSTNIEKTTYISIYEYIYMHV